MTTTTIISDNTIGSYIGDYTGTEDNDMVENAPTTNFGTNSTIQLHLDITGATEASVLLSFSGLSNIPSNAVITSVTCGMYAYSNSLTTTRTFRFRRNLRNWNETISTWNIWDTASNWTTAGCKGDGSDRSSTSSGDISVTTSTGWFTLSGGQLITDVQNYVDGTWNNYGWVIATNTDVNEFVNFRSSDGTDGERPYLSVTWDTAISSRIRRPITEDGQIGIQGQINSYFMTAPAVGGLGIPIAAYHYNHNVGSKL